MSAPSLPDLEQPSEVPAVETLPVCDPGFTLEQCAAQAQWAAAEATARIAELTSFAIGVEIVGGVAAAFAAIFAALAFREGRRTATAAVDQAEASNSAAKTSEEMLIHTQEEANERRALDLARSSGIAYVDEITCRLVPDGEGSELTVWIDVKNVGAAMILSLDIIGGVTLRSDAGYKEQRGFSESTTPELTWIDLSSGADRTLTYPLAFSSKFLDNLRRPCPASFEISGQCHWVDTFGNRWSRRFRTEGQVAPPQSDDRTKPLNRPVKLALSASLLTPDA